MPYEWVVPARIVFGRGAIDQAGRLTAEFGRRVLFVRDGGLTENSGTVDAVRGRLEAERLAVDEVVVGGEPTVEAVEDLVRNARAFEPEVVLGLGGGSALDTAKAAAGLLANGGEVFDYLEVIGEGRAFLRPAVPLVAVPTTAGTGSEATRNAVLTSRAHGVKASLRGITLMPRLALVDPALTDSLPPEVTASTGLDALTQCLESFVALKANPFTDALALEGMRRAARSLSRAYAGGDAPGARDDMSLAALFSGICLANAGLGAVHGLAAALGGKFPVPHGAACGLLLPHVFSANVRALAAAAEGRPTLTKCLQIADIFLSDKRGDDDKRLARLGDRLFELVAEMKIPKLSSYGITAADLPALAAAAARSGSIRQNPVVLSEETLVEILRDAL
ncbi:MAG: iron-containing alcohol dehydrogenase [Candidatus Aminicenantales bacterium]